jgi:hypothetical protein
MLKPIEARKFLPQRLPEQRITAQNPARQTPGNE